MLLLFHFSFKIIGSLASGSGFEGVIYQAELCSSGSLQGVLVGSHYNRAWAVHTVLSEALERMLLTRFLAEKNPNLPKALNNFTRDPTPDSVNNSLFESLTVILHQYEDYRDEARCGNLEKTAQFWLLYVDLMRYQALAHTAVQTNDLHLLISAWKAFIPMRFAMNKVNDAR